MQKAVLSVLGKDRSGIIAKISACLAENNVNIRDISQTIVKDYFTMIMLVDIAESNYSVAELSKQLDEVGKELGVDISLRHEDVFSAMHNI